MEKEKACGEFLHRRLLAVPNEDGYFFFGAGDAEASAEGEASDFFISFFASLFALAAAAVAFSASVLPPIFRLLASCDPSACFQ